jgi:hypothetical protein
MLMRLTRARALWTMVVATALWSIAGVVTRQLESAQSFEVTFWRSLFTVLAGRRSFSHHGDWAFAHCLDCEFVFLSNTSRAPLGFQSPWLGWVWLGCLPSQAQTLSFLGEP